MKKLFLCLSLLFTIHSSFSQKVYFVYLQSENSQAFYVRMGEKILSSEASGYVILSKLRDSTYKLRVGFPDNKWPEQNFSIVIDRKDHGYLLKNFGEKGWGLFDLQTMSVQMSTTGSAKAELPKDPALLDNSVFTDILSKAADDPSLKEKQVKPMEEKKAVAVAEMKKDEPKKEEPKKTEEVVRTEPVKAPEIKAEDNKEDLKKSEEVVKTETIKVPEIKAEDKKEALKKAEEVVKTEPVKTDNSGQDIDKETVKTTPGVSPEIKKEETSVVTEEEFKRSTVIKRSESSTTAGFGLVFIDDNGGGAVDTIRILIPDPRPVVMPVKEEPKEEKKFLDIAAADTVKADNRGQMIDDSGKMKDDSGKMKENKELKTDKSEKITEKPREEKPVVEEKKEAVVTKAVNKCAAVAGESDFYKLRKNMAGEIDNEDMIAAAKKYFKLKCFTTKQIKNLGSMFLDDGGKYRFFDAAYEYVSDIENFPSLKDELKDPYYISRFTAMLR